MNTHLSILIFILISNTESVTLRDFQEYTDCINCCFRFYLLKTLKHYECFQNSRYLNNYLSKQNCENGFHFINTLPNCTIEKICNKTPECSTILLDDEINAFGLIVLINNKTENWIIPTKLINKNIKIPPATTMRMSTTKTHSTMRMLTTKTPLSTMEMLTMKTPLSTKRMLITKMKMKMKTHSTREMLTTKTPLSTTTTKMKMKIQTTMRISSIKEEEEGLNGGFIALIVIGLLIIIIIVIVAINKKIIPWLYNRYSHPPIIH